jgi:hypothetical protein
MEIFTCNIREENLQNLIISLRNKKYQDEQIKNANLSRLKELEVKTSKLNSKELKEISQLLEIIEDTKFSQIDCDIEILNGEQTIYTIRAIIVLCYEGNGRYFIHGIDIEGKNVNIHIKIPEYSKPSSPQNKYNYSTSRKEGRCLTMC